MPIERTTSGLVVHDDFTTMADGPVPGFRPVPAGHSYGRIASDARTFDEVYSISDGALAVAEGDYAGEYDWLIREGVEEPEAVVQVTHEMDFTDDGAVGPMVGYREWTEGDYPYHAVTEEASIAAVYGQTWGGTDGWFYAESLHGEDLVGYWDDGADGQLSAVPAVMVSQLHGLPALEGQVMARLYGRNAAPVDILDDASWPDAPLMPGGVGILVILAAGIRILSFAAYRSTVVRCTGLDDGQVLRVADGTESDPAAGGEASVDAGGLEFPLASVEVLDGPDGAVVDTLSPTDGVWGGDVYAYSAAPPPRPRLLARDIILAARDLDPAFSRSQTPDGPALRFLTRLQQRLLARIYPLATDAVHASEVVVLPLEDFEAGVEIQTDHLYVHGGSAHYRSRGLRPRPLDLVGYHRRLDKYSWPAAYVRGQQLFLMGTAEHWTDIERVVLDLFPVGGTLARLDDPLDLPGQSLSVATVALAAFFAGRGGTSSPRGDLFERAGIEEERYIDQVTGRGKARVYTTPAVW